MEFIDNPYLGFIFEEHLRDKELLDKDTENTIDDNTKCGPKCLGCKKLKGLCDYFEWRQKQGVFDYVLNQNEDIELLTWGDSKPFCEYLSVDPCPKLDPIERSRPALLAYITLYDEELNRRNVFIQVNQEKPKFMRFRVFPYYYESINDKQVLINKKEALYRKINKKIKKLELSELVELERRIC
jgi:hypothetical protein